LGGAGTGGGWMRDFDPREVLARCVWEALPDGRRQILTTARRAEIEVQNADMAEQALRVLGTGRSGAPPTYGGIPASRLYFGAARKRKMRSAPVKR
jgi:hypothetical protein